MTSAPCSQGPNSQSSQRKSNDNIGLNKQLRNARKVLVSEPFIFASAHPSLLDLLANTDEAFGYSGYVSSTEIRETSIQGKILCSKQRFDLV